MVRRRLLVLAAVVAVASAGATAGSTLAEITPSQTGILVFYGSLDAGQVVAGSTSTATGAAVVAIDTVAGTLTTDLQWSGLTGPADRSHVHSGAVGSPTDLNLFHEVIQEEDRTEPCPWQNGFDLCAPASGSLNDVFDIGGGWGDCVTMQCIVDLVVPNGFFIDMHTEAYHLGEIRGQLVLQPYQADGRVRVGTSGAFIGDDIFNSTAAHQKVTRSAPAGTTITYQVSVQNDAPLNMDTFTLAASGAAAANYTVKYFAGAMNITAAMEGGTYLTRSLLPGWTTIITVTIKVKAGAPVGSSITRKITITPCCDPTRVDAVKVVAKRS